MKKYEKIGDLEILDLFFNVIFRGGGMHIINNNINFVLKFLSII